MSGSPHSSPHAILPFMHGAYKTPGGKMVVVDCAARDGRLVEVVVSGDFFLYPEDALVALTAAVEGLPVNATVETIAAAITHAVGNDVTFLGFSPEAVGIAVTRAVAEGVEH